MVRPCILGEDQGRVMTGFTAARVVAGADRSQNGYPADPPPATPVDSPPAGGVWRDWSGADLTVAEAADGERLRESIDVDNDGDGGL